MASKARRGLSLIEVVASIALLSVLMVSMLSAWTRHKQQLERSEQKLVAAELLDEQLAAWFSRDEGPPFPATGRFGNSGITWRTYRTPQTPPMPGGLLAVTVEALDRENLQLLSIEVASSIRRQRPQQGAAQ